MHCWSVDLSKESEYVKEERSPSPMMQQDGEMRQGGNEEPAEGSFAGLKLTHLCPAGRLAFFHSVVSVAAMGPLGMQVYVPVDCQNTKQSPSVGLPCFLSASHSESPCSRLQATGLQQAGMADMRWTADVRWVGMFFVPFW
jgi:hypothetical protein